MQKQHAIRQSFNKAAATYDQHGQVQATVGENLIHYLQIFRDEFDSVIDVGCGTGSTTEQLAREVFYKEMDAIDIAENMLPDEDAQHPHYPINYYEHDFNDLDGLEYDLIFANMSLHWSEKFTHTLASMNLALHKDGLLAFTIPLHGTFKELEDHFQINEFFDLETVTQLVQSMNYQLLYINKQTYTTHFQDTASTLRSIKNTGANYVNNRQKKSLVGKSHLLDLDITQLTYEIGYFIAKRKS